jgi:hypothetical protein
MKTRDRKKIEKKLGTREKYKIQLYFGLIIWKTIINILSGGKKMSNSRQQ